MYPLQNRETWWVSSYSKPPTLTTNQRLNLGSFCFIQALRVKSKQFIQQISCRLFPRQSDQTLYKWQPHCHKDWHSQLRLLHQRFQPLRLDSMDEIYITSHNAAELKHVEPFHKGESGRLDNTKEYRLFLPRLHDR